MRFWAGILASIPTLAAATAIAQEGAARFPREAREAWSRYARIVKGSCEVVVHEVFGAPKSQDRFAVLDDSPLGGTSTSTIRFYRGDELAVRADQQGKWVFGRNRQYHFSLRASEADSWLVQSMEIPARGNGSPSTQLIDSLPHTVPALEGLRLERAFLPDVVESPTFRVLRTDKSFHDKMGNMMTVEFAVAYQVDERNSIEGGAMSLLMDHHWLVWDYKLKVQSADPGTVSAVYEYQPFERVQFPKRLAVTYEFPKGERIRYVYSYDVPKRHQGGHAAFRLSAFGLPEPTELSLPWWERPIIGFAGLGLLLLACAFIKWRLQNQ